MKIKKTFGLMISIGLLLLSSCKDNHLGPTEAFSINIYGYPDVNFVLKDGTINNKLELEIYKRYYVHLKIEASKYLSGIERKFNFNYETEDFNFKYESSSPVSKSLTYILIPYQLNESSEFKIMYESKEYTIDIKITNYDFVNNHASKPTIEDLENKFPTFKEMIDSIQYHTFASPFLGEDPKGSYGGNTYFNYYQYIRSFEEEYDLEYLDYLLDSIYYPASLDLAIPNIASKEMRMTYDGIDKVLENAPRSTISDFKVGTNIIDPEHTAPTNPLLNLNFHAVPLQYEIQSEEMSKQRDNYLQSTYYLLTAKYPEQYLTYSSSELTILIIQIGETHVQGYFEDETYCYQLSCDYQ